MQVAKKQILELRKVSDEGDRHEISISAALNTEVETNVKREIAGKYKSSQEKEAVQKPEFRPNMHEAFTWALPPSPPISERPSSESADPRWRQLWQNSLVKPRDVISYRPVPNNPDITIDGSVLKNGCIKFYSPKSGDKIYVDPVAMAVKDNNWRSSPQFTAHAEHFKSCFLASRHTSDMTDLTEDTCLVDLLAKEDNGQMHPSEGLTADPDAAVAGGHQSKGNLSYYDIGVEAGTDQSEGSLLDGTKSNVAIGGGTGKRKRDEGANVDTQRDGKGKEPAL